MLDKLLEKCYFNSILKPTEKSVAKNVRKAALDERAVELRSKKLKPRTAKNIDDMKEVIVTPEMAAHYLERNTSNRTVRDDMVMRYANDMLSGAWQRNGETLKFAKDGAILDGQHRLYAVLESGIATPFFIMENLSNNVQLTIDTGVARSMGDVFTIQKVGDAKVMASVMRWWYWYIHERDRLRRPYTYSHSELMNLYNQFTEVREPIHMAHRFKGATRIVGLSPFSFVFSGASLYDPVQAEAWAEAVATGENLSSTNPAMSLRERLLYYKLGRSRLPIEVITAYTLKSWNAWVQGKTYKHYKFTESESFPLFYGLKLPKFTKPSNKK